MVELPGRPTRDASRWCRIEQDGAAATLHLAGSWRLPQLAQIESALAGLAWQGPLAVDASALEQIDSASALVLLRRIEPLAAGAAPRWQGLSDVNARVLDQVRGHRSGKPGAMAPPRRGLLARVGYPAGQLLDLLHGHLNFLGATVAALARLLVRPTRLRPRELSAQLEQTGLAAIPVVALVTSLIGARTTPDEVNAAVQSVLAERNPNA